MKCPIRPQPGGTSAPLVAWNHRPQAAGVPHPGPVPLQQAACSQPPAADPARHKRGACATVRLRRALLAALASTLLAPALARTSNGNDFALAFAEARDDAERKALLAEALNRPHFFRYLQIMEIGAATAPDGTAAVRITAFEPASLMDVRFTVSMPVSLALLRQDPPSKVGDALAVTGVVTGADHAKNTIELGQTIVRHKDRLSPKLGKEMLCEVDPGAVFYNYTAGSRPVTLTWRDRDLIRHKERILAEKGPDGWVEFLEQELARRNKQRLAQP